MTAHEQLQVELRQLCDIVLDLDAHSCFLAVEGLKKDIDPLEMIEELMKVTPLLLRIADQVAASARQLAKMGGVDDSTSVPN